MAQSARGLTLGDDGNLYGTSYQGGTSGFGKVFRITLRASSRRCIPSWARLSTGRGPSHRAAPRPTARSLARRSAAAREALVRRADHASGEYRLLHAFTVPRRTRHALRRGSWTLAVQLFGASYSNSVTGAAALRLDLGTAGGPR